MARSQNRQRQEELNGGGGLIGRTFCLSSWSYLSGCSSGIWCRFGHFTAPDGASNISSHKKYQTFQVGLPPMEVLQEPMRKKHIGVSKQMMHIFTVHSFFSACICEIWRHRFRTATTNSWCVSGVLDPDGWTRNIGSNCPVHGLPRLKRQLRLADGVWRALSVPPYPGGPAGSGDRGVWCLWVTWVSVSAGTRLREQPEVQGGKVHHRAGPHDQGQRLGLRAGQPGRY